MTDLADAMTAAAWRDVLVDPLARIKRSRARYLRSCLDAQAILAIDRLGGFVVPAHWLDRDGMAMLEMQVRELEREIYGTGTLAQMTDASLVADCDCAAFRRNFAIAFDDEDLRHWSAKGCPFCGKAFAKKNGA